MSDKMYGIVSELFHEDNAAFHCLPERLITAFYKRLYGR